MTTTAFTTAPVDIPTAASVHAHLQQLLALRDGLLARAQEIQMDILRAEGKLDLLQTLEAQSGVLAGAGVPRERTTLPQEPRTASTPYVGSRTGDDAS